MISLSMLVVGILVGLMLYPMLEAFEDGTFFNWVMKMNKRIKKKHQVEDDIAFLAIPKDDSLKLFFIPFEGKRWRRL